jgi:hypothetical protein
MTVGLALVLVPLGSCLGLIDPGIGSGGSGKGYVRLLNGATGVTLWQVNGVLMYRGLGWRVSALHVLP